MPRCASWGELMDRALPRLPDPGVFSDPNRTIRTDGGDAAITFDPGTLTGVVYIADLGKWTITTPVSFEEFVLMVTAAGWPIAETPANVRWYEANATPKGSAH